jgi:4-amino-4-deoxy-L-arabinose transferase-like glycosyltransferase
MENRLAGRNGGRLGLAALVAILLLGLGLRLGEAWDGRAPVYDAQAYAAIGANLERGEGFTVGPSATQPSSNYSPGLPLLLAGVYELTGGVHERTARVLLALLGTLSILFTYLIGRRLARVASLVGSGRPNSPSVVAGLFGAAAVAIYPALTEYQGMTMSEPLAATLLAGAVLALIWARSPEGGSLDSNTESGGLWRWLVAGGLLGALTLVRPEYLAVSVLLAFVLFALEARAHWRRGFVQAAILLAGVLIVIAPWSLRNAIALNRLVPVSTGGGQVLFAGTYLPSDGDPERVGEEVVARHPALFAPGAAERLRLEQILARLAAARYPGLETDRALSRMGREQLWEDVGDEPLKYAGFVATKIARIWSHGPRDVMREPLWEAFHWALFAFGLLSLALLAWRRRWEALVLATIFVSITAISALLVASPRRVLVMLPLVAALAGTGATWAWNELRAGRRPRRAGAPQAS